MATQCPMFYIVDESANYTSTNVKTKKDILYFERDTKRCKLGTGERWNDIQYYSPSVDVRLDQEIKDFIESFIQSFTSDMNFEPRIDEKGSAFNKDFGSSKDSVARGKHEHVVKDITDLNLPEGVNYPATPQGYVLHDNKKFGPVETDVTPVSKGKLPISSGWAYEHEKSKVHLNSDQVQSLHEPVQVSGPGLHIEGQVISLKTGDGSRDVSLNGHNHPNYADKEHTHKDNIEPGRLPAMSKEFRGAVPPTGNPSGRTLHDDGSWGYAPSVALITLDKDTPFWVVPAKCEIIGISIGSTGVSAANVVVNEAVVFRASTGKTPSHGVYSGVKEANIRLSKGDIVKIVLVSLAVVQISAIIYR